MSNDTNLQQRVEKLEQTIARKPATGILRWFLAIVIVLAASALLGWNIWLLRLQVEQVSNRHNEHLFWIICHTGSTAAERTDAFLRLAAAGNTEWRSAQLARLKLEGADLAQIDLQQANLEFSNLVRADLTQAELTGTSFQLVDMTEADLTKAVMIEASLLKTILANANLREAKLIGATLEQANAREANFIIADLTDAHLLMTDLSRANLTGANLTGANLEAAILRGANLSIARLNDANIRDTDFTDCNWWRARGLSPDDIAEFQRRFPPTKNADQNFIDDYEKWSAVPPTN